MMSLLLPSFERLPIIGVIKGKVTQFVRWLDYPSWVWFLVLIYITLPLLFYVIVPFLKGNISSKRRVIILVLGDLGHSPRMCYHARSFADKGYTVDLCGYIEEQPPIDLIENENIDIHEIRQLRNTKNIPFIIFGIHKVLYQIITLASLVFHLRGSDYIMVQNPPSIPVLFIAVLFKLLTGSRLIIDWHNLGYTILTLKLSEKHPFVVVSKLYERVLSHFADINLTVTKKMAQFLKKEFGVKPDKIVVLYDKPASQFRPLTESDKLDVIKSHPELFDEYNRDTDKIMVTSTSFTPDEDFSVLVSALKKYDQQASLPNLTVIVTGKGPLKESFLKSVRDSDYQKVFVRTAWLSAEEYPKVIATADLGVSLHTSSSGLDLPMKILDMFGCAIPVIAMDFPAMSELVENYVNGMKVLWDFDMYESFIYAFMDEAIYEKMKQGAFERSKDRWESNWKEKFGVLLP